MSPELTIKAALLVKSETGSESSRKVIRIYEVRESTTQCVKFFSEEITLNIVFNCGFLLIGS